MSRLSDIEVDEIVRTCLSAYEKLPKSGKPTVGEWTVVSGVVRRGGGGGCELAALGTGTKCLGASQLGARGDRLADSHAEVVARRAFMLYLYEQIARCRRGDSSIFERVGPRFRLASGVEFVFYSSQLPCGDAAIVPMGAGEPASKRARPDVHRTGARPVGAADPRAPGAGWHAAGAVRTKPGRGPRSASAACSDKLARWLRLGLQGALLHMLCGAVCVRHYVFGGGVPYSEDTLRRAFVTRNTIMENGNTQKELELEVMPEFYQSHITFQHIRSETNKRPSPTSIIWVPISGCHEVAIEGRKQGLTKKAQNDPKNFLCISKYKLYERFMSTLEADEGLAGAVGGGGGRDVPYGEMKGRARAAAGRWRAAREGFFGVWPRQAPLVDAFRLPPAPAAAHG